KNMFLPRIKGIHLALLAFVLFGLIILLIVPQQVLHVDEFWQYWQSSNLRDGSGYHLDVSPSPLHNLLFSFFPSNIILLRIINALLMSLAVYIFYYLVKMISGHSLAVVATLVFIIQEETLVLGALFYTEALFTVFYLLSFYCFIKLLKEEKIGNFLLFGLWSGLMIQSRLIGLLIYGFFLLFLFFKYKRVFFSKKFLWSFIITLTISLPYMIISRFSFVLERQAYGLGLIDRIDQAQWANLLGLIIVILFFLFFKTKEKNELELFVYFSIFYYLVLHFFVSDIYPRHFFVLVPVLIVLLVSLVRAFTKNRFVMAGSIIVFLLASIFYFQPVESYFSGNYFLLKRNDCFFIKTMNYNCSDSGAPLRVNLPFYSQPINSSCNYSAIFKTNQTYNFLYLSYLDDYGLVSIDEKTFYSPFALKPNNVKMEILAGQHQIDLAINNLSGPGGIGQIALCRNNPGDI
ncbi:glycosyltransferase family 39 protein, partial [Patescibacteria group bacterium]|nr:glycosyltransferase family 39 protein [Patescibacteria group bacterium]